MTKGGINKQIILLKLNVTKFAVIEMNFVYIHCYTNPLKKILELQHNQTPK